MNPMQMMQAAKNPAGLAQMLKQNQKIMSTEMGKNFVVMLEKGDMDGISTLGQNISQTTGITKDSLMQNIPEPMKKMFGM